MPSSTESNKPDTMPQVEPLAGQSCKRIDGADKVAGRAMYGADLFPGQAELFAKVVRSPEAHARVLSLDTSKALAVEGVVGVYTHKDVGGTNRHGLIRRDHPVLVEDHVRYRGDALALVVAKSERAAESARDLVEAHFEKLPVIGTIDQALASGAPKIHPDGNVMGDKRIRKGDVEAALRTSDVVVSDTFETQTTDHAFLDLEAGIARWDGELLTIHAAGQWVHEERRLVALALGLGPERIRIIQPCTGGAFGGREDISIQIHLGLAALHHPGKTIALRYSRSESMIARHKRHALRIHYTLGAKRDGTLTAARIVVYSDEGAYASTGIAVMRKAASHATGPLRVPNVSVDVYGVHTNNNPTGAMRGFGACQMAIASNGIIERLARVLKMGPVTLFEKNLIEPGDEVTTGQHPENITIKECLRAALDKFHSKPYPNDPLPPHLKRGWGVSVMCFGLGYGDGFPDCSRAKVAIDEQGIITVYTGGVDVGQGLLNMAAQVAGTELGAKLEHVRVVAADTGRTDESGSSSATRQTYFTGNAVRMAASELREQLLDITGNCLKVHPHEISLGPGGAKNTPGFAYETANPDNHMSLGDLVREGKKRGYPLEARAMFKPRTVPGDPNTGKSPKAFVTYLFGAHVSQVLVDIETGETRVERHIGCHDVGKAINPQSVEGQIAGGVAQGIGMALMEEVVMRDGRMLNPGFTDYIVPTIRDIPPVEAIYLEHDDPGGPYGAHGVGEPPLIGAVPAVLAAIYNATGAAPNKLPCNPENMWWMLNDPQRRGDFTVTQAM
ncbi:MAG: xanthine dehydrogenase family protein [Phycisphaerae bacterium]|nr:xanthine dehydrogenase family protein [Phycisphaerae bacterium]